jgi:hypothetical protein
MRVHAMSFFVGETARPGNAAVHPIIANRPSLSDPILHLDDDNHHQ